VALSALFNIRHALEDPFEPTSPDAVNVRRDMGETQMLLWLSASGERVVCKATAA
jgi:hypothetical protein